MYIGKNPDWELRFPAMRLGWPWVSPSRSEGSDFFVNEKSWSLVPFTANILIYFLIGLLFSRSDLQGFREAMVLFNPLGNAPVGSWPFPRSLTPDRPPGVPGAVLDSTDPVATRNTHSHGICLLWMAPLPRQQKLSSNFTKT